MLVIAYYLSLTEGDVKDADEAGSYQATFLR